MQELSFLIEAVLASWAFALSGRGLLWRKALNVFNSMLCILASKDLLIAQNCECFTSPMSGIAPLLWKGNEGSRFL